jgi:hypothetical protein
MSLSMICMERKQIWLRSTNSPLTDSSQSTLAREDSEYAQEAAVQQHLTKFEVNPVPEQQTFEKSERQDEGQHAG